MFSPILVTQISSAWKTYTLKFTFEFQSFETAAGSTFNPRASVCDELGIGKRVVLLHI